VLQHQEGDLYGSLQSSDLKAFLEFFADPEHDSFCLVTSRAPLMDLEEYTTYLHRDVDRLSPQDGRELLRRLGVQGKDEELDRVVANWDGHALTLSLLASYLRDCHGGDLNHINDIPPPTADEPKYERVKRVLRRYDEHLLPQEKAFLKLFGVFRRPIGEEAFDRVFRAQAEDGREEDPINASIAELNDSLFRAMVERLLSYRILRREIDSGLYTVHPLVRAHYKELLTSEEAKEAHRLAKDYYQDKSQEMPDNPSLVELSPAIEAVHHACQYGSYDDAYTIHWVRISQKRNFYILHKLGAWAAELEIMRSFFPGGDTCGEPQVSSTYDKGWILNEVGLCLQSTGQVDQAEEFYRRALSAPLELKEWADASSVYENLSNTYLFQGLLLQSAQAADDSLVFARIAHTVSKRDAFANKADRLHMLGQVEEAGEVFREAEKLEKEIGPRRSLYSHNGILYANHLNRVGEIDCARNVAEANLRICERNHWLNLISSCHRVLGDICANAGQQDDTAAHYRMALDIARSISDKPVLIEALLARGRWEARYLRDPDAAFSDLNEALEYVQAGGYRIYEADIRVALAWAHLAASNQKSAREEAEYARRMSDEMSYHWGKIDADEVLSALKMAQDQGLES